jgi:predicted Fe-Mo cluster-binding NifX family protein
MILVVPLDAPVSNRHPLAAHFGTASQFAVYDTETSALNVYPNPKPHRKKKDCAPLDLVTDWKPDAVLMKTIGVYALRALRAAGVKVYPITDADHREDVLIDWRRCLTEEVTENHPQTHGHHRVNAGGEL